MDRLVDECLEAARLQMSHSSIFLDPFYPFPEINAQIIEDPKRIRRIQSFNDEDNDGLWSYLKAYERVTSDRVYPQKPLEYIKRQLKNVEKTGQFNFANFKPAIYDDLNETIFIALDSISFSELIFDNVDFLSAKMLVHLDGFMAGGGCGSPIQVSLSNCFNGCLDNVQEFMDCRWSDWLVRSLNLSLNGFGYGLV